MKTSCAVAIVLLISFGAVSQDKHVLTRRSHRLAWQLFAPRGLGFRVMLPGKPLRIRDWIGNNDPDGFKSVDAFGVESRRGREAFAIVALLPSDAMRKKAGGRNDLKGLGLLIGGDDAEPENEHPIKVKGLAGTEFTYHFPDDEVGHRRGRVIDGGKRIFVLLYYSNFAADLSSARVLHFFNSFTVAKAHRVFSTDDR